MSDSTTKVYEKVYEEEAVTIVGRDRLLGVLHHGAGKTLVILCHGFTGNKCENKRLFVEAARTFVDAGFNALRFDFYGSGDSAGEFHETRFSRNLENLRDVTAWARGRDFETQVLLGISMGAAAAIVASVDEPPAALITWSAVPDFKRLFQSRADSPEQLQSLPAFIEYDGWLISRDFFLDALRYDVQSAFASLTIPKLVIQGSGDDPVFVEGFRRFQDVAQPPADFMEIPGAGHTFQTPQHRKQVIRQTTIWLQRHF